MEQSKKTSFDFYMLPLVLAVAVVPLLTMMTAYSSGIGKYTWASGGSFVDFFLGFKRGALIVSVIYTLMVSLPFIIILLFCFVLRSGCGCRQKRCGRLKIRKLF